MDTAPALRFSPSQARAQLAFAWPGVVRRHREVIDAALAQVDEDFIARFIEANPKADSCAIARCGAHELILRGLSRGEPVAYWVEGRLLGSYRAFGIFAGDVSRARVVENPFLGVRGS